MATATELLVHSRGPGVDRLGRMLELIGGILIAIQHADRVLFVGPIDSHKGGKCVRPRSFGRFPLASWHGIS